jgi:hypothetical protein
VIHTYLTLLSLISLAAPEHDWEAQAGLSLGAWNGALVQETELDLGFAAEPWTVALHVPLRFRLADVDGNLDPAFRERDWDDPGDFLHVLNQVKYRTQAVRLAFGTLPDLTLGHGELVRHLANNLDVDRPESGLYGRVAGTAWSVEAFLTSLLDPDVMGARGAWRPLAGLGSAWGGLELDAAWVADVQAPARVDLWTHGRKRVVSEPTSLVQAGLGWRVQVRGAVLVPYASLGLLDDQGGGVHLGLEAGFRPGDGLRWALVPEYRFTWQAYAPEYFNTAYPLERYRAVGGLTKLGALLMDDPIGAGHGFSVRTRLEKRGTWSVEAALAERQGANNADGELRVQALLGPRLSLALVAVARDAEDLARLPAADVALAVTEVRWAVWRWLGVRGFYAYSLRDDANGLPEPFHRGLAGLTASLQW